MCGMCTPEVGLPSPPRFLAAAQQLRIHGGQVGDVLLADVAQCIAFGLRGGKGVAWGWQVGDVLLAYVTQSVAFGLRGGRRREGQMSHITLPMGVWGGKG